MRRLTVRVPTQSALITSLVSPVRYYKEEEKKQLPDQPWRNA